MEGTKMSSDRILWNGLGFPVVLVGFPLIEVDGEQFPDVNMKELQEQAFLKLIAWPARLTGQQVRFARNYLRETQIEFAKQINVSTPSVSQWEKKGVGPTGMDVNTEIVLRMHMLHSVEGQIRRRGLAALEWASLRGLIYDALSKLKETSEPLQVERIAS
jgi:DNA-binding transcriptional regulator YiaG